MKRILLALMLSVLCALMSYQLLCAAPSPQEDTGRDLAFEQAILDRLGKIDPDAIRSSIRRPLRWIAATPPAWRQLARVSRGC